MRERDRLIVCDLDGTLVDTLPGIAHAAQVTLERLGLPPPAEAAVRAHIGGGARPLMAALIGPDRAGQLDDAAADFAAYYNAHADWGAVAYPGVTETLAELTESTVLGLATAKSRPGTDLVLAATGLGAYFDHVVTLTEMARPKPDPDCLVTILRASGVPAARALYVGDTPTDVATARAAGVACWAVAYGYGAERLPAAGGYDRLIDDFRALAHWAPVNGDGSAPNQ